MKINNNYIVCEYLCPFKYDKNWIIKGKLMLKTIIRNYFHEPLDLELEFFQLKEKTMNQMKTATLILSLIFLTPESFHSPITLFTAATPASLLFLTKILPSTPANLLLIATIEFDAITLLLVIIFCCLIPITHCFF